MEAREAGGQQQSRAPVRIAYLVVAHKSPEQLVRLVRKLNGPDQTFVIHVDRTSCGLGWDQAMADLRGENMYWADRVECSWGDFSIVQATLNCLKRLKETGSSFDFVILLSGQDYPIKDNAGIREFLRARRGQSLMYLYPFPYREWPWRGYHRLPTWRVTVRGRARRLVPVHLSRFIHQRIPGGLHPFGGSQWWCLSGQACEYVHEYVNAHPEFVDYFKRVMIPDELFFQTIIGNSPWRPEAGPHSPHFARWSADTNANPDVLHHADFAELKESGKLFARKFDLEQDPDILDRLESELDLYRDERPGSALASFSGGR